MTSRRRVEHSASCHHWCQPRLLLLLPSRRAFRADTRRGMLSSAFAPSSPRYVCLACGLTADDPELLCDPELIELAARARHEHGAAGHGPKPQAWSRREQLGSAAGTAAGYVAYGADMSWTPQQWLDAGGALERQADEAERIAGARPESA